MRDETAADGLVPVGLFGVEADHEPLRPRSVVPVAVAAGADGDFLDPQVPGDGAIAARPGQCGGGLAVGVAVSSYHTSRQTFWHPDPVVREGRLEKLRADLRSVVALLAEDDKIDSRL